MKRKIEITYRWWGSDNAEPAEHHLESLMASAWSRIVEMVTEGYTSGELHANIGLRPQDGPTGVKYSGWWEMKGTIG
jgi:hypothetical protein